MKSPTGCRCLNRRRRNKIRLIDADNALELFRAEYQNTENLIKQGEKQLDSLAEGYTEAAHIIKHISPTVDAVPVTALLELRDDLHEHDQITMQGLMKLNALISRGPGGTEEEHD